eukprot:GHVT01009459.1.p1 GENE.GHVT01009459.1~~GHVT01009459.1.p1  ORF type:complete len:416 (+),score=43.85 GHVT01009459.1:575-1822(+)
MAGRDRRNGDKQCGSLTLERSTSGGQEAAETRRQDNNKQPDVKRGSGSSSANDIAFRPAGVTRKKKPSRRCAPPQTAAPLVGPTPTRCDDGKEERREPIKKPLVNPVLLISSPVVVAGVRSKRSRPGPLDSAAPCPLARPSNSTSAHDRCQSSPPPTWVALASPFSNRTLDSKPATRGCAPVSAAVRSASASPRVSQNPPTAEPLGLGWRAGTAVVNVCESYFVTLERLTSSLWHLLPSAVRYNDFFFFRFPLLGWPKKATGAWRACAGLQCWWLLLVMLVAGVALGYFVETLYDKQLFPFNLLLTKEQSSLVLLSESLKAAGWTRISRHHSAQTLVLDDSLINLSLPGHEELQVPGHEELQDPNSYDPNRFLLVYVAYTPWDIPLYACVPVGCVSFGCAAVLQPITFGPGKHGA